MKKNSLLLIAFFFMSYWALAQEIPSSFDLRDYNGENYVTSVKDQTGGTCWTHGTMAAMESNLLMTGAWSEAGETGEPNLAEYHLDWWNGYNQFNNDDLDPPTGNGLEVHMGGDYRVSTAYLSRLEGAVRDVDGQSYSSPPERHNDNYHYYYPRRVEWYTAGENLETIDTIKVKLMEHGAIATCMAYDGSFIDGNFNHYQPMESTMLPNHSITIIGWDDNHVVPAAPENGAWLCKNSWGEGWGNSGYFWISYYDKWACQEPEMGAVAFIGVEPLQYDDVYYHDYHGWRDTYAGSGTAFNAYTATRDSWLKSVNFFTATDSVEYEIRIYDNFDESSLTELRSVTAGVALHEGLQTVDLALPFWLTENDNFYIYLDLDKGGIPYDRTSDVPVLLGGSAKTIVESTANKGESYYFSSCCGWEDFFFYDDPSTYTETGNFCIKGLTNDEQPESYGVVFKVFNQDYGWGLYNAEITLNGEVQYADNQGYAVFSGITPTEGLEYSVIANAYNEHTGTVDIVDNVVYLDLGLSYAASVSSFADAQIAMYPNPTSGMFQIDNLQGNEKIEISDVAGKIIIQISNSQKSQNIDLTGFGSGIYFVKITQNGKIYSEKIVLE